MRRLIQMPPQLFRIVMLAVAIVVVYSIARFFLTPPTFGEYGWFRGKALAEISDRKIAYAGKPACEACHVPEYEKLMKHEHKGLACESCHGPGEAHNQDPRKDNIQKSDYAVCLRCHEANPSRPKWHKQIVSKEHYTGSKCSECHVPHSPQEVP